MAGHHRAQQLRSAGTSMHTQVLRLGVLTFGLCGIELSLAPLGAVDLELRSHLAQRLGGLIVAAFQ